MIRVDESVRLVEAVFGGVAELEGGSLVTERPEDGFMRDEPERDVYARGLQLRQLRLQVIVATFDFVRQRLVFRRDAFHCVDDAGIDELQRVVVCGRNRL